MQFVRVDEETEEEWIKNNELIDPIATILNDSPVKRMAIPQTLYKT